MPPQESSGLLASSSTPGAKKGNYARIVVVNNNDPNVDDATPPTTTTPSALLPQARHISFGSSNGEDDGSDGDGDWYGSCCRKRMLPLLLAVAGVWAGSGMLHWTSSSSSSSQQQQPTQPSSSSYNTSNSDNDDSTSTTAKDHDESSRSHSNPANNNNNINNNYTGPYQLLEAHHGASFLDYYDFYQGPDSLGSAGFNTYVSKERATEIGLFSVIYENSENEHNDEKDDESSSTSFVLLQSAPTEAGPRESLRLEGKRRFHRGLFILDLDHMPTGCGVWPAFWLTDEEEWPNHGEIDILEGINDQSVAKTALHTSDRCNMYAHVPGYAKTGYWDSATGIPNTWTGEPDYTTRVEADNCWVMAPHQWANQGCVAICDQNGTLGAPLNNEAGGGIFALEWDPANRYIRSWVFPKNQGIPANLQESIDTAATAGATAAAGATATAASSTGTSITKPDTDTWGLPYAYFAIGETTGCSADHFQNMRLVINLAFCGTVSGNRYFTDCPRQAESYQVPNDPVGSCNAWIQSQPPELDEAYFKIRGVYVYEREPAS